MPRPSSRCIPLKPMKLPAARRQRRRPGDSCPILFPGGEQLAAFAIRCSFTTIRSTRRRWASGKMAYGRCRASHSLSSGRRLQSRYAARSSNLWQFLWNWSPFFILFHNLHKLCQLSPSNYSCHRNIFKSIGKKIEFPSTQMYFASQLGRHCAERSVFQGPRSQFSNVLYKLV